MRDDARAARYVAWLAAELAVPERRWEPFRMMRDLLTWDPFREITPYIPAIPTGFMPAFEIKASRGPTSKSRRPATASR